VEVVVVPRKYSAVCVRCGYDIRSHRRVKQEVWCSWCEYGQADAALTFKEIPNVDK